MHEADAALIEKLPIGIVRVDDDEAVRVELEVALDQGQRAFADRSEADHHDRAVMRPCRGQWVIRSPSRTSDAGVFEGVKAMAFRARQ